jgi:hypothetical protein
MEIILGLVVLTLLLASVRLAISVGDEYYIPSPKKYIMKSVKKEPL